MRTSGDSEGLVLFLFFFLTSHCSALLRTSGGGSCSILVKRDELAHVLRKMLQCLSHPHGCDPASPVLLLPPAQGVACSSRCCLLKPNMELVLAAGSPWHPYPCPLSPSSLNFFLEQLTPLHPWLCKPREPGCCSRLLHARHVMVTPR